LEEGDLNEYNQCQTQLKELYKIVSSVASRNEFVAYRLLYYIFLTGNQKYTGGSSDLFKIMLSLSRKEREDAAIKHALKVREAVADMDYHAFFRLRKGVPNLGNHLMDQIVPGLRYNALQIICKAYKPEVELSFALEELGFGSSLEVGQAWLLSCGCVFSEDKKTWNTKDSVLRESDMEEAGGSLI
jgi:hypothetical protein